MGDLTRVENSIPVQLVDANDLQVVDIQASAPIGTESGIITRNIPSGTQTIEGTVTASPTGTYTVTLDGTSYKSKGLNTLSTLAPTGTAALVAAVNANRSSLLVYNAGAVTIFLGQDNTVTTGTGIPLLPNASLVDKESKDSWYAITGGSTGDLRILETAI